MLNLLIWREFLTTVLLRPNRRLGRGRFILGSGRGILAGVGIAREAHPHASTPRSLRMIEKGDVAAVLLEDLGDDGEAEAGAAFAGGHVGLQQPLPVLTGETDAVVDHVDRQQPVGRLGQDEQDQPLEVRLDIR